MRLESYGDLCAQFYDISKPEPPADAFGYYLKLCKSAGGPVLEPMCGSGRFLIPLLQSGIEIEGSDASPEMLKACRDTAAAKGLKPVLYRQFIERTRLPRKYRLMIIPSRSFILVTDRRAAMQTLRRLYEHLLPGGSLVLEIDTPKAAGARQGVWMGRWVTRPDGATISLSALDTYEAENRISRSLNKYELFENGRLTATELEHFAMRFYEKDEFTLMLKETGFKMIRVTRPYGKAAPDENDKTIVFSGRKEG